MHPPALPTQHGACSAPTAKGRGATGRKWPATPAPGRVTARMCAGDRLPPTDCLVAVGRRWGGGGSVGGTRCAAGGHESRTPGCVAVTSGPRPPGVSGSASPCHLLHLRASWAHRPVPRRPRGPCAPRRRDAAERSLGRRRGAAAPRGDAGAGAQPDEAVTRAGLPQLRLHSTQTAPGGNKHWHIGPWPKILSDARTGRGSRPHSAVTAAGWGSHHAPREARPTRPT